MDLHFVGYIAAVCTSMSFLPQALKVIRTRDTSSLSLSMYSVFSFGVSLWLVYGIYLQDIPMILANVVTLFFALIILSMKIHHRIQKRLRQRAAAN